MSRELKRILYGLLFLLILGFAADYFYVLFLKPAPNCHDGIQNQNEQGIDCGGVCGNICLPANLKPIALDDKVRFFYPFPARITVLFKLKNPNDDYLASFSFEGTVIGADGSDLGSFSGDSFLYPGEDKYTLVPNITFDNPQEIGHIDLAVSGVSWTPSSPRAPDLSLADATTTVYKDRTEVDGDFTNNEPAAISKVSIVAIFYNEWGLAIGATKTEYLNIAAGEKQQFAIVYPVTSRIDPGKTQLFLSGER